MLTADQLKILKGIKKLKHGEVSAAVKKCSPNFQTENGSTPLILAISTLTEKVLKALLTATDRVDIRQEGNVTVTRRSDKQVKTTKVSPLEICMAQNLVKFAEMLFKYDPSLTKDALTISLLFDSITSERTEIAKVFINAGVDVNATDEDGTSLLMAAVMEKNLKLCQFLKSKGANCSYENHEAQIALDIALDNLQRDSLENQEQNAEIVLCVIDRDNIEHFKKITKFILETKIKPQAFAKFTDEMREKISQSLEDLSTETLSSKNHDSADMAAAGDLEPGSADDFFERLYKAVTSKDCAACELLITESEYNAAQFVRKNFQITSIFCLAIINGSNDIVSLFLKFGFSPDAEDSATKSPVLFVAIDAGNIEACRLLLVEGAGTHCFYNDETPLLYAAKKQQTEIVELLLNDGANWRKVHKDGRSLLTVAAQNRWVWLCLILLSHKVDYMDVWNVCKQTNDAQFIQELLSQAQVRTVSPPVASEVISHDSPKNSAIKKITPKESEVANFTQALAYAKSTGKYGKAWELFNINDLAEQRAFFSLIVDKNFKEMCVRFLSYPEIVITAEMRAEAKAKPDITNVVEFAVKKRAEVLRKQEAEAQRQKDLTAEKLRTNKEVVKKTKPTRKAKSEEITPVKISDAEREHNEADKFIRKLLKKLLPNVIQQGAANLQLKAEQEKLSAEAAAQEARLVKKAEKTKQRELAKQQRLLAEEQECAATVTSVMEFLITEVERNEAVAVVEPATSPKELNSSLLATPVDTQINLAMAAAFANKVSVLAFLHDERQSKNNSLVIQQAFIWAGYYKPDLEVTQQIRELLVKHGALTIPDEQGNPLLHAAIISQNEALVDLCLSFGKLPLFIANEDNLTPLDLAVQLQNYPMCQRLLEAGAHPGKNYNKYFAEKCEAANSIGDEESALLAKEFELLFVHYQTQLMRNAAQMRRSQFFTIPVASSTAQTVSASTRQLRRS